jgi:hypothetical protein
VGDQRDPKRDGDIVADGKPVRMDLLEPAIHPDEAAPADLDAAQAQQELAQAPVDVREPHRPLVDEQAPQPLPAVELR